MMATRLGTWSAAMILGVGIAYLGVLAAGMARHGLREPITDPLLAVMEVLTLLAAAPILTLIAALAERARDAQRLAGSVALAFATMFAATTGAVHFVGLTAGRQTGGGGLVWPSTAYALELLAWDVFLGLALIAAAGTVVGAGRARSARLALFVTGVLCLAGTVGPAIGNMRLQLIGVTGYAAVLPVAAVFLLRFFAGERAGRTVA